MWAGLISKANIRIAIGLMATGTVAPALVCLVGGLLYALLILPAGDPRDGRCDDQAFALLGGSVALALAASVIARWGLGTLVTGWGAASGLPLASAGGLLTLTFLLKLASLDLYSYRWVYALYIVGVFSGVVLIAIGTIVPPRRVTTLASVAFVVVAVVAVAFVGPNVGDVCRPSRTIINGIGE